jgi:ATP-dependent RNA helicase RhlE
MPFEEIGLSDPLVKGILATGYTAPTEIQAKAIPSAIEGKDIIGCAQTGTGKTAAFVLPMLNRLSHENRPKQKSPRALILTPTRELAGQIEKAIQRYGRYLDLKTLAVYGGVDIQAQTRKLRQGVDIVVATPGRLMDHTNRGNINFRRIEVLVLDEADRMLDMGFINDIRKILDVLPSKRQTMLFSATMSREVKALAKEGVQKSPVIIEIGEQRNPVETVTHHIYPVAQNQKKELLLHMMAKGKMFSVLIFSRTKHGADKISKGLDKAGIKSVAIHSNRTQRQRERALEGFRRGKYQVMVATDIAARGIDVSGISHVINYDVPAYAEDYIHRIGRTGRAENKGDAITFVCREEEKYLFKIEKFIGRKFKYEKCEGFSYDLSRMPKLKEPGKDQKYKGKRKSGKPQKRPAGKGVSSEGSSIKAKNQKSKRKFNTSGSNAAGSKARKYGKKHKTADKGSTAEGSATSKKKFKSSKFKSKTAKAGNKPYNAKSKSGAKARPKKSRRVVK